MLTRIFQKGRSVSMKFRKTNPRFGYLVVLIVLCLGVAGISSMVTIPAVHGWYKDLAHPSFTPPDAVFGPVWTALYIMMAVASWRAWGRDQYQWDSSCIRLFLIQLALNFAWSFLFFKFHLIGVAAVEIVVLEIAIIVTTVAFLMRDKIAGMLMVPYLLWVGFASALNIGFWSLN
ncbi:TspO and MBR-like protein [Paramagnetospirillum caucaseum]|uniref:TspO and MBR-like protein n=2 Tax=Paramagnetospirillum caucaseum TaxID=1244869 RepID=M2Z2L9_9PROT|nr:TspO and MBR-like protein [Paramagnetospirillum caucaseum]